MNAYSKMMLWLMLSIVVAVTGCSDQNFVVSVDKPLRVVYLSPNDGTSGVAVDSAVTARFSEMVDIVTIENSDNFYVENITDPEASVKVDGTISYDAEKSSAVFTPETPLSYASTYRIVLTKAIQKADTSNSLGGDLAIEVSAIFKTVEPDDLMVIYTNPASGSWDLPVFKPIKIIFSHPVQADSITVENIIVEDTTNSDAPVVVPVAETDGLTLSEDGKSVLFTPAAPYGYSRDITVTISKEILPAAEGGSVAGMSEDVVVYFKTINPPPVSIISVTQGNDSENILRETTPGSGIATPFVITFSEGIKQSEIDVDGDGALVADDGSVIIVEDITDAASPVFIPCRVEFLDSDGDFASDPPLPTTNYSEYLKGRDSVVRLVPNTPIGYSRLVRITIIGDTTPPQYPLADVVLSDRATDGGGQLAETFEYIFRMEDPASFAILNYMTQSGFFIMPRTDSMVIGFSEGVDQTTVVAGTTILVEDVTALADPLNDIANETIAGTFSFNADDDPDGSDLIGADDTMVFTPNAPFPYGTLVRFTIPGSENPEDSVMKSDRATERGGQLRRDTIFIVQVEQLEIFRVIRTIPGHDARSVVHTTDEISVTFSAAPDCATINSTNLTVTYDQGAASGGFVDDPIDTVGAAIAGLWACTAGNATVVFTANEEFGWGRDILLQLSEDVRDARAVDSISIYDPTQGYLVPAYSFGFGTEEMENVNIIATNASGSLSFVKDNNVRIIFDREIDCARITDATLYIYRSDSLDPLNEKLASVLLCSSSGTTSDTVEIDAVDNTADAKCDGTSLCFDTEYTFVVMGGYEGVCVEEKLAGDFSDAGCIREEKMEFSFKTELTPELTVEIIPAHNTTGVPVSIKPTCTFNKSIRTSTVTTEPAVDPLYPLPDGVIPNICIVKGKNITDCGSPDVVPLNALNPYSFTTSDTVVTINPLGTLSPNTWYTVVVSRDIEDATGKRLNSFYSSAFLTSAGGLLKKVYTENGGLRVVAEFAEDVDLTTVHPGTIYLTYVNEFGGTTFVPATLLFENWDGGGVCDPASTGDTHCDAAALILNFTELFSCGETSADPQYALPLNTEFTVHVATYIRNSNYLADFKHVESAAGTPEYLYLYTTIEDTMIQGVEYANVVVGPTLLGDADEVPVNSQITLQFDVLMDLASFTGDTLLMEDGRGLNGSVATGSSNFTSNEIGTFLPRDVGKRLEIINSDSSNGMYEIITVVDDKTVELSGIVFSADETELIWSRYLGEDAMTVEHFPNTEVYDVIVTINELLNHHSDYRGHNAVVTAASHTITIETDKENFRVNGDRDLGRTIVIAGSNVGNNISAQIILVNEVANTLTINKPFVASESGLSFHITSDVDYHLLKLIGRSIRYPLSYIKAGSGIPLAGTFTQKFLTSPETNVTFAPNGATGFNIGMNAEAIFSRKVHTPSLNEDTFYMTEDSIKHFCLSAFSAIRPRIVRLTPVPALEPGFAVEIIATDAIWDYRGNPIISRSISIGTSGDSSATPSITPSVEAVVTPAAPSQISGDQTFVMKWDADAQKRYFMSPGLINSDTFDLVQILGTGNDGVVMASSVVFSSATASFVVTDADSYIEIENSTSSDGRYKIASVIDANTVTLDTSFVTGEATLEWTFVEKSQLEVHFVPDFNNGDRAELRPLNRLRAGNTCRVLIDHNDIANLFNIAYDDDSSYPYEYIYTVEQNSPTATDILAVSESTGLMAADGLIDVTADSELTLYFDEHMASESFSTASVILTDSIGTVMDGLFSVFENRVVFTPTLWLQDTREPYTLTITTAVTDTAGNMLSAEVSATFSVETTAPQVLSTSPVDAASGLDTATKVVVTFTEQVDGSTLIRSTTTDPGNITLFYDAPANCNTDVDETIYGCMALDKRGTTVTYTPFKKYPLFDEKLFTASLSAEITDRAGNLLDTDSDGNANVAGDFYQFSFDTLLSDSMAPVVLCSHIDPAANTTVDVYVNEDLMEASFIDNIAVYEVVSGLDVAGAITLTALDGYPVIRFTADAAWTSGMMYGMTISNSVQGVDGNSLYQPYTVYFTAP